MASSSSSSSSTTPAPPPPVDDLAQKIADLEAKIGGYEADLTKATTKEEKSELRNLITACTNRLTELEKQKNAQVTEPTDIYSLEEEVISRISSAVLRLTISDYVNATAVVWDFVDDKVRILTNYHTWDINEFPPNKKKVKKSNKKRKAEDKEDVIEFNLKNDNTDLSFELTSDIFLCYDKESDFAVLQLPCQDFEMRRIPIGLDIGRCLKIHTFGYVGHTGKFNVCRGIISSIIPHGFTMNILSAPGYSGAAIISDGTGRAVGYMIGNYDASEMNNSQHQSYGFRFDNVVKATNRDKISPPTSPSGKYIPKNDISHDKRSKKKKRA